MKAPTADYSSLSQALSSKTSALQTSYAAKDASNWKSSYDIQQQSFDLSKRSLDLQEESTKVNGIVNVASGVVQLGEDIASAVMGVASAKQDAGKQDLTMKATQMSSDWETLLNMNPDFMTELDDPVTGAKTLGLSEKGQEAYSKLEAQYFPSDTKYGWGLDDIASNIKQNLKVNAVSYAQSLALSNIQGQADAAYSYNLDYAQNLDLQSGETETVTISDGNGGTRTLTVGKNTKALIDSRSYLGASWQSNQYEVAAQNLVDSRQERIISDVSEGYTNGTYITDAAAREALSSTITAHLDSIEDPTERATAREKIKTAISSGIQTYFTNRVNSIMAQDTDSYSELQKLYNSVSTDGDFSLKSLFYDEDGNENPYVDNVTLSNVRSTILSEMSAIEETAGTVATNKVSNGLSLINSQLKSGSMSPEGWVGSFRNIMADAYGSDWMFNDEAKQVFDNTVLSLLPEDLKSDLSFKAAWNSAVGTMFNMNYEDLDYDQQVQAIAAQTNMMNDLMDAVVNDPTIAMDPNKYAETLSDIASRYNATYLDIISGKFEANYFQTIGGNEGPKVFNSSMNKIVDAYSELIEENINDYGVWDRSGDNLPNGVNDTVTEALTVLAKYTDNTNAKLIAEPKAGQIEFEKDDDGNLKIKTVTWDGYEIDGAKGKVIYNASSKSWKLDYEGPSLEAQAAAISAVTGTTVTVDDVQAMQRMVEEADNAARSGNVLSPTSATIGETAQMTLDAVKNGNIYTTGKPSKEDAARLDNSVDYFVSKGGNNGTDGGLEQFLWSAATDEASLDSTLEKLKAKHESGEFEPGMSSAEYDEWSNSIADKVRTNRGWKESDTDTETPAETAEAAETPQAQTDEGKTTEVVADEETTKTVVPVDEAVNTFVNTKDESDGALIQFLMEMATDEERLDDAVEKLKEKHANKETAADVDDDEYNEWVTGVAERIKAVKKLSKASVVKKKETVAETPKSTEETVETPKEVAAETPKESAKETLVKDNFKKASFDPNVPLKEQVMKAVNEEQTRLETKAQTAIGTLVREGRSLKTGDIYTLLESNYDCIDTFADKLKQAIADGDIKYNNFSEIEDYYKDVDSYIDATVKRIKNEKKGK